MVIVTLLIQCLEINDFATQGNWLTNGQFHGNSVTIQKSFSDFTCILQTHVKLFDQSFITILLLPLQYTSDEEKKFKVITVDEILHIN